MRKFTLRIFPFFVLVNYLCFSFWNFLYCFLEMILPLYASSGGLRSPLRQITLHFHQRLFKLGNGTTKTNGTNIVRFAIAKRDSVLRVLHTRNRFRPAINVRLIWVICLLRKYPRFVHSTHSLCSPAGPAFPAK